MTQAANNDASSFLFYCDMAALSLEQRKAHVEVITRLFGSLVQETQDLPDGYAYRFDGEQYALLAEFIMNERRCCPFLSFQLDVTPFAGSVWLRLTADGDVKPFLRDEIGYYLPAQ